jgi:hypothetical protein
MIKLSISMCMVEKACYPSTEKACTGGFPVQGQPVLHSEKLSKGQKAKIKQNKHTKFLPKFSTYRVF